MKGYQISFYTRESEHRHHKAMGEWLLEQAKTCELRGATLIKASEGFGKDHKIHAARFFDLSDEPVVVTMIVSEQEKVKFFDLLESEEVEVLYTLQQLEFGTTGKMNE